MHKGIMLIVKTDDKTTALAEVRRFLEDYKETVWDWYQIGGRWTQTFAPKNKEFMDWADKFLKAKANKDFISSQSVKDNQRDLQKEWERLGMNGENPYTDHYHLPEGGNTYDIMPLKDCIGIVKKWQQTIEDIKKEEEEAKEWINGKRAKDDYRMYGYCLKGVGNLYHQDFCFDTNIFNIDADDYSIPEKIEDYSVVMIDIHN